MTAIMGTSEHGEARWDLLSRYNLLFRLPKFDSFFTALFKTAKPEFVPQLYSFIIWLEHKIIKEAE